MEEPLDEISVPAEHVSDTPLPLFGISVQAGLPTPAEPTVPQGEDRSLAAGNGDLAVIKTHRGLFARAISVLDGRISFIPEQGLPQSGKAMLFGVITGVVRPLRNGTKA